MRITPIKTDKILPKSHSLYEVLDKSINNLDENSIVVITSKIVSLCEGRTVPISGAKKKELVEQEAEYYLPKDASKYGYGFTITNGTLIPAAGIDESNSNGNYLLWPKDSQATANQVRKYLCKKFGLKHVGVIITDSTCFPMRRGTLGIPLAHSGFLAINNYVGKPDLFGRPFSVSAAGIALGLSAAAVSTMGEGTEQTPLAVIEDVPFVQFQDRDPNPEEIEHFYIGNKDEDLFAPFINSVNWQKGQKN